MNRKSMFEKLKDHSGKKWDVIIIGGGASGLGIAVDAATRGYKTILFEQSDFAKGTSSRSTKLVHGGVRYLANGDISLVLEALTERGLLLQNAPHLVRNQAFIIPNYDWWDGPFYAVGMKVYDMMAGDLGLGPSQKISKKETHAAIPNLDKKGLSGGVIYFDGQFDDARMAINLAQTAEENDAVVLNYMQVTGLTKTSGGLIDGVRVVNVENGIKYKVSGRVVINATGVFADNIISMDDPSAPAMIRPSQGIHIVLDKKFLKGDSAIMIPKTSDGRVLFAVPWHGKVIVGTTDTEISEPSLEPRALQEEIDFILDTAALYLEKDPTRSDVKSIFAGLRPLAAPQQEGEKSKEISRSHKVVVCQSGLVNILGGKWTTYRKMAEDTLDKALMVAGLKAKPCVTRDLRIHGYSEATNFEIPHYYYGSDRVYIADLAVQNAELGEKLHPDYEFIKAQVVYAVRNEMARTVEDFLARRIRILLLDTRASMEMVPVVAELMAKELDKDEKWVVDQIAAYNDLAMGYIFN